MVRYEITYGQTLPEYSYIYLDSKNFRRMTRVSTILTKRQLFYKFSKEHRR